MQFITTKSFCGKSTIFSINNISIFLFQIENYKEQMQDIESSWEKRLKEAQEEMKVWIFTSNKYHYLILSFCGAIKILVTFSIYRLTFDYVKRHSLV